MCPTRNFCVLWHWHIIFGTWVYRHEMMCYVHSWSWYNIDLCLQGQIYRVYDMALCSSHSFLVLWNSHMMFGTWVYHHGTMCRVYSWPLYDLDLWPQFQTNIFTINLSLARLSLLFDIGILNFGIWVYYHNTICCVQSWLLYDLDLWPICEWQGVSLVRFTHSFLAHLSWRLKWAFLIKICPLFLVIVVVIVVINFSHFHLLLQNHCANFKQTCYNASLGEGDSSLLKWKAPPFSKGR